MKKEVFLVAMVAAVVLTIVFLGNERSAETGGYDPEAQTYAFLIENGLTPVQTAGVMSAIKCASNFDCKATDSNNIGFGLLKWSWGRRENLEKFSQEIGKPMGDLETQLLFLMTELEPGPNCQMLISYNGYEISDFWEAKTPMEAAESFCMLYERPAIPRLEIRKQFAVAYYEKYAIANVNM